MRARYGLAGILLIAGLAPRAAHASGDERVEAYMKAYAARMGAAHASVPSFSRQTGLACSACHYQFLALNPFGRQFKLNGYTLSTLKPIKGTDGKNGSTSLSLSPIGLFSAMVQASYTKIKDGIEGVQNGDAAMPQQMSGFLAGAITPRIGVFAQFTYSGADNAFGIDNIDLRYAKSGQIGKSTSAVYGFTLHNNPTVQDLWNTTPAWGFPFAASDAAPTGLASTLIDGGLAQQVLGLGAYTMLADLVYGEVSLYRSAIQGKAAADAFAISGVAPYWRLALQKTWDGRALMVGAFGLHTKKYPGPITGAADKFTDLGFDAQAEGKVGRGNLVFRGTFIRENQTLDGTKFLSGSANLKNTLNTAKVNASYYPSLKVGLTAGLFSTTGSTDAVLYPEEPVSGSATGSPNTGGFIGEFDFNPWENTRLGVQYTAYRKFNGLKTGYDGALRNASGNNTVYLIAWVVF